MPNRSVFQRVRNLTPQKILRAYQVFGSCRAAGKVLGISRKSVERHLRSIGIELKPPGGSFMKGKSFKDLHPDTNPLHYSCLANWIREHKDVSLPRDISAIVEMTHCSENSVRAYLRRRGVKL